MVAASLLAPYEYSPGADPGDGPGGTEERCAVEEIMANLYFRGNLGRPAALRKVRDDISALVGDPAAEFYSDPDRAWWW